MVRMHVAMAALASLFLTTTPAQADEAAVCILRSVETRTPPRKPNVIANKLDCGASADEDQKYLADLVNNAETTQEALQAVVAAGYEVESASWRDSFSGRQELGIIILVNEGDAPEMEEEDEQDDGEMMSEETEPAVDETEEAEPEPDVPPLPPADQDAEIYEADEAEDQ